MSSHPDTKGIKKEEQAIEKDVAASLTRVYVAEKIEVVMKLTGLNERELAEKLRTSQPTLHRWKMGEVSAPVSIADAIEAQLGFSADWVLGEKETPFPPDCPDFKLIAVKMRELLDHLQIQEGEFTERLGIDGEKKIHGWLAGYRPLTRQDRKTIAHEYDLLEEWWDQPGVPVEMVIGKGLGTDGDAHREFVSLPLIEGALRADSSRGYDMDLDQAALASMPLIPISKEFIRKPGPHCVMKVDGDSMWPRFSHGDYVLVNLREHNLEHLIGCPVAAWLPDMGAVIKILKKQSTSEWSLHSVNNDYEDIPIPKDQPHFRVFEVEATVYHAEERKRRKKAA